MVGSKGVGNEVGSKEVGKDHKGGNKGHRVGMDRKVGRGRKVGTGRKVGNMARKGRKVGTGRKVRKVRKVGKGVGRARRADMEEGKGGREVGRQGGNKEVGNKGEDI